MYSVSSCQRPVRAPLGNFGMFRHSMAAEDNGGGVVFWIWVVAYPDISRHSNLKRLALKLKLRLGWTFQNLSIYLKPMQRNFPYNITNANLIMISEFSKSIQRFYRILMNSDHISFFKFKILNIYMISDQKGMHENYK